jgi:hypothetical protein
MCVARNVVPRIIVIATTPRIDSVIAAFLDCGRRNARMPLEMASTPVSADAPEENAYSTRNSVRALVPVARLSVLTAAGHPWTHRARPTPISTNMLTMNPYTGNANSRPDSRTPRRLATAISTMHPIDSSIRYAPSAGTAETIASTPATTDTDTVST